MDKKKFVVKLESADARAVERIWYEYNGTRDIMQFLAKDTDVQWKVLDEFRRVAAAQFAECEMTKNSVANKYKPEEVDLSKYNYSYDFFEDQIVFEEA